MPRSSRRARGRKASDSSESDDEDLEGTDYKNRQRLRMYQDNNPSMKDLERVVERIQADLAVVNNDRSLRSEVRQDTIVVGLSNDGHILVTGNLKERRVAKPGEAGTKGESVKVRTSEGNKKVSYKNYGLHPDLAERVVEKVKESKAYRKSNLSIKVIEEKSNPRNDPNLPTMMEKAKDHASKHAEMKMVAHCDKEGTKVKKVAISKEACKGCHGNLKEKGVKDNHGKTGKKKVTNWREVDQDEVTVIKKVDRDKEVEVNFHMGNNNVKLSKAAMKEAISNNVKQSFKPGGSVGLITGASDLVAMIKDDKDPEGYAHLGALQARAGSAPVNLFGEDCGRIAQARASVLETRVGVGRVASVGATALSAGAHAEYGWNNSVGADVTIARVDANLGPVQAGAGLSFDTHASVGVNGVSASFLGMGFSVGPRLGIRTPFFDFSVSLF